MELELENLRRDHDKLMNENQTLMSRKIGLEKVTLDEIFLRFFFCIIFRSGLFANRIGNDKIASEFRARSGEFTKNGDRSKSSRFGERNRNVTIARFCDFRFVFMTD